MRYKRKTSKTEKKYGMYFHAEHNGMCTGKKRDKKVNLYKKLTELQNTRTHSIFL